MRWRGRKWHAQFFAMGMQKGNSRKEAKILDA